MMTCTEDGGSGSVVMLQMGTQQTAEMPALKQAHTVSSTKNMERVENVVHDDTHQAICCVSGTEYVNRHYKYVGVNKVCSQQVPHPLTHEKHHMSVSLVHMQKYCTEGESFLWQAM
jgi:hypothetical protein